MLSQDTLIQCLLQLLYAIFRLPHIIVHGPFSFYPPLQYLSISYPYSTDAQPALNSAANSHTP